ncbi:MAG: hypothetical protein L3K09_02120 [Thermoplasmata archaeon]|nr:hypothetical protein [Thermoplasmata archaeon]
MGERAGNGSPLARRRLPWMAALSAGVVLLLAFPTGFASSPVAVLVKAPYQGAAQATTTKLITGCGKVHVGTPARFSMRSGTGGFAGSAGAKFCNSGVGGQHSINLGLTAGATTVSVLLPKFSGNHLVIARLTLTANGNDSVSLGPCALKAPATSTECNQSAFWDAGVNGAEVYQSNGNSYWYSSNVGGGFSNWSGKEEVCRTTGCIVNSSISGTSASASGVMNVSVYVNVTGAYAGQTYYIDLYLYSDAGASCSSSAGTVKGCSARAAVNFATGGNGVRVDSIRVY